MVYELLSVEDLVRAKKTQWDQDWPMIRRLVEAHHRQFELEPTLVIITFWLRELTTPELLTQVALENKDHQPRVSSSRPWLLSKFERRKFDQAGTGCRKGNSDNLGCCLLAASQAGACRAKGHQAIRN